MTANLRFIVCGVPEGKPTRRVYVRNNPGGAVTAEMLSDDQLAALNTLLSHLTAKQKAGTRTVCVLAGAAGTGKTTLMRVLISKLQEQGIGVALLAPTGKAAARLRDVTGLETATVHSFIYGGATRAGICPKCEEKSPELGVSETTAKAQGITSVQCPHCKAKFPASQIKDIKKALGFAEKTKADENEGARVAIVDEASMVGKALDADMRGRLKANYSILYVGDREQLPPVVTGKEAGLPVLERWGPDFAHPTANLTQVHRQAADNPIIDLATRIRNDQNRKTPFRFDVPDPDKKITIARHMVPAQAAKWLAGMRANAATRDATLITYTNKLRQSLNWAVREYRGLVDESKKTGLGVVRGDRLLIRANNKSAGIMNGEVVIVEGSRFPESRNLRDEGFIFVSLWKKDGEFLIHGPTFGLKREDWDDATSQWRGLARKMEYEVKKMDAGEFDVDDEWVHAITEMSADELFEEYGAIRESEILHADFGECVTAHTSQGSQWKYVGVVWDYTSRAKWVDEYEEGRRWLYTAITRAADTLVVFDIT